ncbi:MAG: sodium:solute symporter [Planctomycetota bacterium]
MHAVDWTIVLVMLSVLAAIAIGGRMLMKDVAGYLAAGRSAGRYLLTVSATASMVGAISIIGFFEQNQEAGFVLQWWEPLVSVAMVLAMLTGWVIYRFRQTRCLTLAEFFERRYSRRFRIFAGLVAFASGMLNFGIFPSVGARFFLYFCGLPDVVVVAGVEVSLFVTIMIILLATSLAIVLLGGQVCVLLTDFLQGAFTNVSFVVLTVFMLWLVDWSQVAEVLMSTEPGVSKVNPFDTSDVQDFNYKYFLIGLIGYLYARMAWQGTQAYNASARSAHEAKMGAVLYIWNDIGKMLFTTVVPVLVFVLLHHADWGRVQVGVQETAGLIESDQIRSQMLVPMTLREVLPVGLRGMMAAMMLGAFISTHTTYMHSWSSIFIQDVVLPLRSKKSGLSQRAQLRLLRGAACGVAMFALIFSTFVLHVEAVLLYFAATGAIFVGWSGAVIIGGLYWRYGTARSAWVAAIAGILLVVAGLVLQQANQVWRDDGVAFFGLLNWLGQTRAESLAASVEHALPNGQQLWGWAMVVCSVLYVAAAFPFRRRFDLDRLLHRGAYRDDRAPAATPAAPSRWSAALRMVGVTEEFTRRDRWLYVVTIAFNGAWIGVLAIGSAFVGWHVLVQDGNVRDLDSAWIRFWQIKIWIMVAVSATVTVWLMIGGFRNVIQLLRALRLRDVSEHDTGIVSEQPSNFDEDHA